MTTPLSSMALVLLASLIGSVASVLLKAGANHLHRSRERLQKAAFRLSVGVALFLISSVFYVWGIKDGSLTVLYPMVSLGYVWTLVWSKIFFGEPINRTKLAGVGLVLVGVVFIAVGNQ
jgi:drug/metabolite transporter (DMT)-like permease